MRDALYLRKFIGSLTFDAKLAPHSRGINGLSATQASRQTHRTSGERRARMDQAKRKGVKGGCRLEAVHFLYEKPFVEVCAVIGRPGRAEHLLHVPHGERLRFCTMPIPPSPLSVPKSCFHGRLRL